MKLLEQFKEQLKDLGELRYVWFTSFNINLEFIESYLLPAVLEMDPPKNRLDYEHFQLALSDRKIDFRIFCDKRFMQADQNKRTSIPVHGVSTASLENFSKDSLFHPKVIYLEDVHGKRILGAGSANLTLSGWGRNQEVFSFHEITTRDQQSSVKLFFDRVMENVGINMKLRHRNNLPNDDMAWSFVHSFQNDTFLDQLFYNSRSRDLMVWSAYLPKDLSAFICKLVTEVELEDLKVHLVPDRVEGQYIRTSWSEKLKSMVDRSELTFYDNPTKRHDNVELCHSKIWKLGSKLAMGSWNFTRPGSNLYNGDTWDEGSNIEAGVILSVPASWQEGVGQAIEMTPGNFASSELLEEECLEVPELLPFDIAVTFDWREQRYAFSGNWNEGNIVDGYSIKVPNISKTIPLVWRPQKKVLNINSRMVRSYEELLTEHRFEIFYEGKVVHHGLITETNFSYRRAQAFESLGDLLDAFVFGGEPGPDDAIPFLPAINNNSSEDDSDVTDVQVNVDESGENISYFRLFQATQQYAQTIEAIKSVDELNGRIFTQPGCLLELVEKAKSKTKKSESNVFDWFLANEVKSLCILAKKRRRAIGNNENSLPTSRWHDIDLEIPQLPEKVDVDGGYVEMVMGECRYVVN